MAQQALYLKKKLTRALVGGRHPSRPNTCNIAMIEIPLKFLDADNDPDHYQTLIIASLCHVPTIPEAFIKINKVIFAIRQTDKCINYITYSVEVKVGIQP